MGLVNADNRETMAKARTCCRGVGPSSGSAGEGDIQHFPQHPLTNRCLGASSQSETDSTCAISESHKMKSIIQTILMQRSSRFAGIEIDKQDRLMICLGRLSRSSRGSP